MENPILRAVLESLKPHSLVKAGNIIVLGKVNSLLKGRHLYQIDLESELSDEVDLGYFIVDRDKNCLNITELGVEILI